MTINFETILRSSKAIKAKIPHHNDYEAFIHKCIELPAEGRVKFMQQLVKEQQQDKSTPQEYKDALRELIKDERIHLPFE